MRTWSCLGAGLAALGVSSVALAGGPSNDHGPFSSPGSSTAKGSYLDAARAVVSERATPALASTLGAAKAVALAGGETVVRLPQMHLGVPVALRGATVTFAPDGRARLLSMRVEAQLDLGVEPSIDAAQAAGIASARAGAAADASRATLAIWPTANGPRLAWVVYPKPSVALHRAPLVVVDAHDGGVLTAYDAAVAVNQSNVYPSNPTKWPDLVQVTLPVGSGQTTLQSALVRTYNCIDQKTVKSLFGFDVHTCDLLQTALPDASSDWFITPGADTAPEDAFSEVSMFYHASRAYDFFRGFSPTFVVQADPLDAVSNLRVPAGLDTFDMAKMADPNLPLEPFQNAFFAPSNPIFSQVFGLNGAAMWFGQGPKRDYAYDGDVVYHELTHAVVNATVSLVGFAHADAFGLSQSPGGMNEGLADYFSSAITGDPDVGEYAVVDFGGSGQIRSLTDPDSCPADIGGEVHQDATLFSGGLWDVRATLDAADAAALDLAIFTAMNAAPTGDLGYEDLATLIVDAVNASPLGAAVADQLTAAFTKRGVLPGCKRVLEYAGSPLSGPAKLGGNWLSIGLATTDLGDVAYAPGIVQIHAPLPERTETLTLRLQATSAGGGGFGQQGTPFAPQLLVRFGADPITFTYAPFAAVEGALLVELTKDGSSYSATVTGVPAGATDAYVMLVNAGEQDGAYSKVEVTTTSAPPDDVPPPDETTTTGAGKLPAESGTPEEDSGCGCRAPRGSQTPAGAALVALAIGLVLARRHRRRPR